MESAIQKAVIPVAGLGTRLRPLSAVLPKAMFPVPDREGRILPVLHHVLAEAASAGVVEAAVVVSPGQERMLGEYLNAARSAAAWESREAAGRKPAGRDAARRGATNASLPALPARVVFIVQEKPLGFGHAVWLGKKVVGDSSFLVMLGDHIHLADRGAASCAAQVTRAFAARGGAVRSGGWRGRVGGAGLPAAMIGVQMVEKDELPRVGTAGGQPLGGGVYRCTDFIEKPTLAAARRRLRTPGLPKDRFLAHSGIYAFSAEIFECIEEVMRAPAARRGREVQLADAQSILLRRRPGDYYLIRVRGQAHDTGTPACYAATWKALLSEPV